MPTASVVPETIIEGVIMEKEQPSLTYSYNPDTNRIHGMVDGAEAVQQWITHAITAERYANVVYNNQFGSEIKALMGDKTVTNEFQYAEIERMVRDCLSVDPRITGIGPMEIAQTADNVYISFDVSTIFGVVQIDEVRL